MDVTYTVNLSTPVAVAGVLFLIAVVAAFAFVFRPVYTEEYVEEA